MNKNTTLTALTLTSMLTLIPFASAQQGGAAQPGNMPPRAGQGMPAGQMAGTQTARTQMAGNQMPAAFTLVRKVDSLTVIGKNPKTAFSKAQASALAALLTPLKTAKTLTNTQASSVSASIDRLLTPAQRPALKLAESQMGGGRGGQMQGGQMQGGQQGGGKPMQGGQMNGGQMQGAQAQQMAPGANPFLSQRGGMILTQLLSVLGS